MEDISDKKNQPKRNEQKLGTGMFILSTLIVMPNILSGMSQAYSAIAIPQMNLTIDQASWFASSPFFTAPIGVLLQGTIIDSFGRKSALLVNLIPHFIGWLLIYWNRHLTYTFVGRFLCGLTTPSMFYVSQIYAVECITINHPNFATSFKTWPTIADSSGMLLVYVLGVYFNYWQTSIIAASFSVIMFCIIALVVPESPSWLYTKGRIGDAEIAESKLGISQPILKDSKKNQPLPIVKVFKFSPSNLKIVAQQIRRREVIKPLIVVSVASIIIAFIGGSALTAYMVNVINDTPNFSSISWETLDVIREVSDTRISYSYYFSAISGWIILFSVSLTSYIMSVVGVRKLTICCILTMLVGWISVGCTATKKGFYWTHVGAVWITLLGLYLGAMNGPVSVLSDTFPPGGKGLASIPIILFSLSCALVNKTFPYLRIYLGGYVYYVYAGVCVLYIFFAYFALPETVDRI